MAALSRTLLVLTALGCSSDFSVTQGSARLDVSPSLSDMGGVGVGALIDFDLDLVATDGDVQIVGVDVLNVQGDYFSLVTDSLPLVASGQTEHLSLSYAPAQAGYHWAQVSIGTDEKSGATHVVDVRGMAAQPAAQVYPSVVDFGPVQVNALATSWFVVYNDGHVPIEISAITLDNGDFSVTTHVPLTVQEGAEQVISLNLEPDDDSPALGTLSMDTQGVIDLGTVALRGNACDTAAGDLYDWDGDGFGYCGSDCDDWDGHVHPGATESCNGVDDDCDGLVDEGTSCVDDDGDGWTEDDGDCNDGDPSVSPGATEVSGNGVDDDCDGVTDSGTGDEDGDGYSADAGDCDDHDASVFPGAAEAADGADNDCDGTVDEGTDVYDDDGDGYTEADGDCDDSNAWNHPGAYEFEDWIDNDCDGTLDENTDNADDDGDGFSENGGDCDDSDASVNPGEVEVSGDGVDNDCDGVTL